jgi:AcrR family transcriptional regulator
VAQRIRIVRAVAGLIVERQSAVLSVSDIVARARVGRTTFYAAFTDADAAVRGVTDYVLACALERASGASTVATPQEQLRSLVAAWLELAADEPECVRASVVTPASVSLHEWWIERLESWLETAERAGSVGRRRDRLRIELSASCVVAAARHADRHTWRELVHATVDAVTHLLR